MPETDSTNNGIQEILGQLQEEIRQHRLALGELGALEPPDPLARPRQTKWVNPHLPIGWPEMPPGIIPKIVAVTKKVVRRLLRWYINPIIEQQNEYNAAVFDTLEAHQRAVEQQGHRLQTAERTVQDMSASLRQSGERLARAEALSSRIAHVEELSDQHEQRFEVNERQREHEHEVQRARLQRLENWIREPDHKETSNQPQAASPVQTPGGELEPEIDYFLLGIQHRSRDQVQQRLTDYDDILKTLRQRQQAGQVPAAPLIDIGCGRGEFVRHIASLGLDAYGIDIDEDAVRAGQRAGVDIRVADAFEHLASLEDSSLLGVSMIQVAEHIEIPQLLKLFQLCRQKTAPGGMVIVETLNPLCLVALTNAYLLDPSHATPLHPQMTRFLLEQAGLERVEIRYLRPVPAGGRLEPVPGLSDAAARAMSRNIERLNHSLYGPQDYAAIAQVGVAGASTPPEEA